MTKAQKSRPQRKATESDKRVALYLRVSTGGQTTANQRRELTAVAKRHGWNVVTIFSDNGSGADDRKNRPGLDAMLKAVARREVDMVAAWSVDRFLVRVFIGDVGFVHVVNRRPGSRVGIESRPSSPKHQTCRTDSSRC
jgi:predicted site-specific integrase-resolvase